MLLYLLCELSESQIQIVPSSRIGYIDCVVNDQRVEPASVKVNTTYKDFGLGCC